jgi:ArsR family transcriptional regulator
MIGEVISVAGPSCSSDEHPLNHAAAPVPDSAALERAARLFRAMGDAPRLRLLELLQQGEWCVTELVEAEKEKFSTISQRLRTLRSEGLIARRRQGKHIFYSLTDRHVADLIHNALAHARELEGGPAVPGSFNPPRSPKGD